MRWFDEHWTPENIAVWAKRQADFGLHHGLNSPTERRYFDSCKCAHAPSGSILIFTRDAGMHSSGWWKNPDYERCYHLSLSFRDPRTGELRARDKEWTRIWLDAVFGYLKRLLWTEPPYTTEGKQADCYHYRLFYSENWKVPILPRDEVYTKAHTPAEWLSWSDACAKLDLEAKAKAERENNP